MKKALLAAIVLAASCLVSIGISSTAPANAVTCTFRLDDRSFTSSFGATGASWTVTAIVDYKTCTTDNGRYARIIDYTVKIHKNDGGCGSGTGPPIDYFRVNPDTVAAWNPGAKTADCPGENHTVFFDAPRNQDALPGDTANIRCMGGYITAVKPQMPDSTHDLPRICII